MCVMNQPQNTSDPVINKLRNAIIHRGLWMGLILKEAKENGCDWEKIGRAAVFKTGCIHGDGIRALMGEKDSLVSFASSFYTEDIKKIFEIRVKRSDETALELEYGHCPLVTAWQQAGIEGELLEKLCDIAMCGDRGIESRFPWIEFKLGQTIAQGHKVCEVRFLRRK
jgi:L-2-amino-thiazoline-4-carboxylic acid hydrolase